MAIAVQFINTPNVDARRRYQAATHRLEELGAEPPDGRLSHVSWMIGDQLHVLDVWESQIKLDAFLRTLGPLFAEFGMELVRPPEVGEVVRFVVAD